MFTQAEIGVKCACDVPETVCKEHAWKRYRLPAGTGERTGTGQVSDIAQVWIDCELGRVAICRHELPEFRQRRAAYRLWWLGRGIAL